MNDGWQSKYDRASVSEVLLHNHNIIFYRFLFFRCHRGFITFRIHSLISFNVFHSVSRNHRRRPVKNAFISIATTDIRVFIELRWWRRWSWFDSVSSHRSHTSPSRAKCRVLDEICFNAESIFNSVNSTLRTHHFSKSFQISQYKTFSFLFSRPFSIINLSFFRNKDQGWNVQHVKSSPTPTVFPCSLIKALN